MSFSISRFSEGIKNFYVSAFRAERPTELQLNKAISLDTEALILDLNLSITNDIVSSKIYYKQDDFDFEIVNFHFLVEMFLARLPVMYIFCNLLVLKEHVLMLMTSTKETNF